MGNRDDWRARYQLDDAAYGRFGPARFLVALAGLAAAAIAAAVLATQL